jgi:Na+-transporting NADH:ubiquinone oxidoreductase subunit NqrD
MIDPNLFHIDWERVPEVLAAVIIISFLIERALSMLFGSWFFIKRFKERSLKELISVFICAVVCILWDLDAVSMIFLKESTTFFGEIITGAIVAGGSKASIELFRNVMGVMSTAEKERMAIKKKDIETSKK